ncbi:MAG: hypothetical protein ACOY3J_12020 [Bacillota bacterium]
MQKIKIFKALVGTSLIITTIWTSSYLMGNTRGQVQEQGQGQTPEPVITSQEIKKGEDVKTPNPPGITSAPKNRELTSRNQSSFNKGVLVAGSSSFKSKINQSLALLHKKTPYYGAKVDKYLKEIRESNHSGVKVETGVFHLGKGTINNQDIVWLASVIVHDAYHVELYKKGKPYAGREAEAACIREQKKFLQAVDAPAHYFTYLDKVLESNYWEIPFENRTW